MLSKYAQILLISCVGAQDTILATDSVQLLETSADSQPEKDAQELSLDIVTNDSGLFGAEELEELSDDVEEIVEVPIVGQATPATGNGFTADKTEPSTSGKFFYMSMDRLLGHHSELYSMYANITIGEGSKAVDYKFEVNPEIRGLHIFQDDCVKCTHTERDSLYPADAKGEKMKKKETLEIWDESMDLIQDPSAYDSILRVLYQDKYECAKMVNEKLMFNFEKNSFSRQAQMKDGAEFQLQTINKYTNPDKDKRNFYSAKYAGFLGLGPPLDAFKTEVPEKTDDFVLNLKKMGAIDNLVYAMIPNRDQGSIKFGSYDPGAIKTDLNLAQTYDEKSWVIESNDIKVHGDSIYKKNEVTKRKTLLSPDASYLYITSQDFIKFSMDIKNTEGDTVVFPNYKKEQADLLVCEPSKYCYFKKQCDHVITSEKLKDKKISIQIEGAILGNDEKGLFGEKAGYKTFDLDLSWEDVLADSGQFGAVQGYCYITIFPSWTLGTSQKTINGETKPWMDGIEMVLGERVLKHHYLVYDARPAEDQHKWMQIGIAPLNLNYIVGDNVYNPQSKDYDETHAGQDTSVPVTNQTFWEQNKTWVIVLIVILVILLVCLVGFCVKKKKEQQTFYSQV